jgi:hypothetical protein
MAYGPPPPLIRIWEENETHRTSIRLLLEKHFEVAVRSFSPQRLEEARKDAAQCQIFLLGKTTKSSGNPEELIHKEFPSAEIVLIPDGDIQSLIQKLESLGVPTKTRFQ